MSVAQPVREDFLDEDSEIPSQRIVLLSFLSPENVLQRKEHFFFQKFMQDYEIEYRTNSLEKFLGTTVLQINRKLDQCADAAERAGDNAAAEAIRGQRVPVDNIMDQYQTFLKQNKKEMTRSVIEEAYKDFLFRRQEKLEDEFHAANGFQTTMRGLKVRGTYATAAEAEARAKKLMRTDPNHNILLGEVGKWLPWDPSPNAIKEQEYAEEQLNQLMKNYKKNEQNVEEFYKERNLERPGKKVIGGTEAVDNGATPEAVARAGEKASASAVENTITGPAVIPAEQKAMFDQVGDLAHQRKVAAAAAKAEKKD
jgi:hypothetical protein